jgi:hypothetical protein
MRFEPRSKFLFPEISTSELATDLRSNSMDYINIMATHYWLKIDAIDQLESLVGDANKIIDLIENELGL